MEIRKAITEDYAQLCLLFKEVDEIHRRALPDVFRKVKGPARPKAYFEKIFTDENTVIFVAEEKGDLLGLVHIFIQEVRSVPILRPRKLAVIDNLVVKKEFRKKGIGKQLMKEAEAWAKNKKASLIELNVWEFNQKARTFYQKIGFETISRKMWKQLA
ncbi:MAG TPA: GNAT family N-acetyltransferase [Clostridia bacterium]|nr:GNAT family N-acetyltransferase [Clostridia bacterium]